ncbi:serine/threonine protein kinase, partial [Mycobacterium rhizamassiliense]
VADEPAEFDGLHGLRPGSRVGHYRLRRLLGKGGFGHVWEAEDTVMERLVALKLLKSEFSGNEKFRQRLFREARAAGRLHEPHVVPIHQCGEVDGHLYIDMRLIDGTDLDGVLSGQGPLGPARAVAMVRQIAAALDAAHHAGLIHRDVKPANILLGRDEFACLLDFGLANAASDAKLTSTGFTVGTFAYLAPERLGAPGVVDHRADIYALTCVLYECLTGNPPYPTGDLPAVIGAHLTAPIPRPSQGRPHIPAAFDHVIARGMAKTPADRYASAGELAAAAERALSTPNQNHAETVAAGTQPAWLAGGPPPPAGAPPHAWQPIPPPPWGGPVIPPARRTNRALIAGGIAMVVTLVIVGVVLVLNVTHEDQPPVAAPTTSTSPSPSPDSGPFTGSYTAQFGAFADIDGKPRDGSQPTKESWRTRSVCRSNTCVATASRTSGKTSLPAFVFDQVGGSWVGVGTDSAFCDGATTERFIILTLRPQPDGGMAGDLYLETPWGCFDKATAKFARTGGVDVTGLPDPAGQAPRVVSPAEALYGRYHGQIVHSRNGTPGTWPGAKQDADFGVKTYCLRSGDRCMSYLWGSDGSQPLVFANGEWTRNSEYASSCPTGGKGRVKISGQYPLPQPPQDPVTHLVGHGVQKEIGTTCTDSDFDETFDRTGD